MKRPAAKTAIKGSEPAAKKLKATRENAKDSAKTADDDDDDDDAKNADDDDDGANDQDDEDKPKEKTPAQEALLWAKKCDGEKMSLMEKRASLKGIEEAVSLYTAMNETVSQLTSGHKDLQKLGTTQGGCKTNIATKCKAARLLCEKARLQLTQSRGYSKS